MRRILLAAGAVALACVFAGLSGCNPDDLADAAVPALKSAAVKVAVGAAEGDTRAREIVLGIADGYCDVAEVDRRKLRAAFSIEGAPAFAVDCGVVHALAGRRAMTPTAPPDVSRPRVEVARLRE